MDSTEFQQLVDYIRDAIDAPIIGLNIQEMHHQDQELNAQAYKAATAVDSFFKAKRKGTI